MNALHYLKKTNRLTTMITALTLLANGQAFAADTPVPEEVTVTATRVVRSLDDIAGTVSVISADDIDQAIMEDMDDLIRYQPGVSMSTASRGGNEGFIIRGIGGNRILMIIDGIRSSDLYAAGPSSYGKDAFEIDDLKSVEIIRGPASVLYGADAMGGAVILHSKSASDYILTGKTTSLGIRGSYNSANAMGKLGLTAAVQTDNFEVLAQFTHRSFHENDINGRGKLNPQDSNNDALLLKLGWQANERIHYTLTLDFLKEEVDTNLLTDLSESVLRSRGQDETDRVRISLAQNWKLNTSFADQVTTQIYWQKTDAQQHTQEQRTSFSFLNPADFTTYGGTLADRFSDFGFNQETTGLELSLQKEMNLQNIRNTFVYGLNFEITDTERPRNRCDTAISTSTMTCAISAYPFAPAEVFPNKTFPDTETQRSGIYLQDEIIFGEGNFTLIPGVRYDRYEMAASISGVLDTQALGYGITDFDSSEVSLSFGLIYDFSDTTSFFAQYAEGFRPPNFNEANQSFVNLGFGYALVPNPDLHEETSKNLEAGIRSSFGNTNLSLAVYRNDYDDFIETQFISSQGGLSLFQEQNTGSVEISGIELQGSHRFNEQWLFHGSLAYSKGDNKQTDNPLNSVDPLTAVFGLRFESENQRWSLETMLTAVAEKDRVAEATDTTADSYQLVDLIGSYNLGSNTKLRLGLFNIFDTQYARWSNIQGLSSTETDLIERSQASGANARLSFSHQF